MTFENMETALQYYAENHFDSKDGKEQTRALFTAYCIVNDICPDTYEFDMMINDLYDLIPMGNDYDTFDLYMGWLLI